VGRDSPSGGTELLDQIAFNSIQPRTRFQLRTSEAGRKHYEVKQIGDALYPISKNTQDSVIPRMQRLLFAQDVLQRPSAAFTRRERLSYCHGDSFISKSSSDGVVSLQGAPPFDVTISIRDLAAGETFEETVTVTSGTWSVSLPSYSFKSIGPHLVTLETIRDASGCEQALPDPLKKSMWVDVAESAAIVPYDRREHFCVGDVSQFQLEGTPPWTIEYVLVKTSSHT
jgi:nucleoporin POM152